MDRQLKILLFLSSLNNQENSWRDTYKKFYFFKNFHYLSYITIINLMKIKFIFFLKSRSTVFKMSIAGDSPELKKINYLQLIIEKLTQPTIDYSYKILPYAKTA